MCKGGYHSSLLNSTLCMLGNIACFLRFGDVSKTIYNTRTSKCFDPDQARRFVRPDLNPNCLKKCQQRTKLATIKQSVKLGRSSTYYH